MKEQDMVPGLAERERRIADAQRLTWLAEVRDDPAPRPLPRSKPSLCILRRGAVPPRHFFMACLRRVARDRYAPAMAR
jgi:hypothetical protein